MDAGAKIYAGRVDAIYNDVYKMLGGFGRANKQSKAKGYCSLLGIYISKLTNCFIESDDEEQEGELCKTKHAKGKKVKLYLLIIIVHDFCLCILAPHQWIFITNSQGCCYNKY